MTSPEALASPSSKSPTRERGQDRPPRVIFTSRKRSRNQTVRRTLGKPLGPYPVHMYPLSGAIWPQQLTPHRLGKVTNLWTSKSWSSTPTCLDIARYLNKIEKLGRAKATFDWLLSPTVQVFTVVNHRKYKLLFPKYWYLVIFAVCKSDSYLFIYLEYSMNVQIQCWLVPLLWDSTSPPALHPGQLPATVLGKSPQKLGLTSSFWKKSSLSCNRKVVPRGGQGSPPVNPYITDCPLVRESDSFNYFSSLCISSFNMRANIHQRLEGNRVKYEQW